MSETSANYTVIDDKSSAEPVPSRTVALRTVTCNGQYLSTLICHFRGSGNETETQFVRYYALHDPRHFTLSPEEQTAYLDALRDYVAPSLNPVAQRQLRIVDAAVAVVKAMRDLLDEDDLAPLFGELDDACTAAGLVDVLPGDEEHFAYAQAV
jgi:hypothetical protein